MKIHLVYRRIPHHAGHSGYDQLARYVRGEPYSPGLIHKIASWMPERLVRKVKAFNSEWYRRESLYTELELWARLAVPTKRLYHFLYGEDALRLSSRAPLRWNNKVVATFHQPPSVLDGKFGNKPFIRGLSAAITLSEEQTRYFYNFLPADRVFKVPHGVETAFWHPDPTVPKSDPPVFVNVGWWLRDIEMLKSTIRRVHEQDPRVRFRIVTFDHLFEHYEGLPNTELVSGISDEALRDEYRRASAILIPLKAVTANNAVLEAMACGTAVVSTNNGGLPDNVDDASGFKVEPGDVDACVRAVLELAQDDALALAMGRAARECALKFDWKIVGEQMSYVHGRVLGTDCSEFFHQNETGPRRICLLTEEYPPETGWGGIATYNYNLAHGLAAAGHDVHVIAGCVDEPSETVEGNIRIHRVKFHPRKARSQKLYWKLVQPFLRKRYLEFLRRLEFGLAARKRFRHLQDRVPIHVVESPEYYGAAWFIQRKFRQYPIAVKLHTPSEVNCYINSLPVTTDVRLSNIFEKRSTKRADLVCAPSRKIMEIVREKWIPDLHDIELLEYPIDPEKYEVAEEFWASGPKVFLFTGRLEHRKGVQILLPAFDRVARDLPDIELHLAGHDTPTFAVNGDLVHFEEYLKGLGISESTLQRVRFLGRKSLEELIPLYQSAYACVIPSVSFENFPNSCLEAVACGKAVIVTDLGGMVEMAPDRVCGLHVKANDVDSLADAIRYMAENPDETRRFGEGSRRTVLERYATGRMIEKIVSAYERLIADAKYR